ncbi:uncharacterized protein FIBRA_00531 [Fibroporia radiculosa]|uniref:Uncharacterized protein n=1 Tax=Fibroporia radiculosa TaxID=599839 RepID=J4HRR8_9APHY|nr:uncharacterized protein FIBRA_00531 [Fibroporia radiculosa]CCL98532.1 predicted protein [Fibroporia radiculosa]
MCVGENCAPQASHYVVAQLTALYENAVECVKSHDPADKSLEISQYSHALAQYSFVDQNVRSNNIMFHAKFGQPQLEFICNHDVVLCFTISSGYYRLDYSDAPSTAYHTRDRQQDLSEVEVVFRVKFNVRGLQGKDSKIGSGQNLINLIILNLSDAQLVSVEPPIAMNGRDAFSHYMSHYLSFLQQAGNHVLFSIPDFDDNRYRLNIDYSLIGSTTLEAREVHGINVDKINSYLASVWLKSALLLSNQSGVTEDWKSIILAEYRSLWSLHGDVDSHFHARLGAPEVIAICSREVILCFLLEEVLFYESDDFNGEPLRQYKDWKVAILANVDLEADLEGYITCCKLDLLSARPYEPRCSFPGVDVSDETATADCVRLLDFFTGSYPLILESVDLHIIYNYDSRWQNWKLPFWNELSEENDDDEESETWTMTSEKANTRSSAWLERVTRCNMFGFDQISAISQSSINNVLAKHWFKGSLSRPSFAQWDLDEFFSSAFAPLTVRLLSNDRAIFWVHMESGRLKALKKWQPWPESEIYEFNDWHLAFEVNLKRCAHHELNVEAGWLADHAQSAVFEEHGDRPDRHLVHLFLDFEHVEFLHEFSSFNDLFRDHNHRAIDKVQAAIYYLKGHFLPYLARWGMHIIHTVPVWTSGSPFSSCALTSVDFQVYSKLNITRQNWATISTSQEPVIAIFGMTQFQLMPYKRLEYSADWIVRASKGTSYGTVCVSRAAFLEQRLLHLLSQVNSVTTIVPNFYGVHNGVWKLDLTTWAKHAWKKTEKCTWQSIPAEREGFSKYHWQHRDFWKYEHEGAGNIANGTYTVTCLTRNFVELPTGS